MFDVAGFGFLVAVAEGDGEKPETRLRQPSKLPDHWRNHALDSLQTGYFSKLKNEKINMDLRQGNQLIMDLRQGEGGASAQLPPDGAFLDLYHSYIC